MKGETGDRVEGWKGERAKRMRERADAFGEQARFPAACEITASCGKSTRVCGGWSYELKGCGCRVVSVVKFGGGVERGGVKQIKTLRRHDPLKGGR